MKQKYQHTKEFRRANKFSFVHTCIGVPKMSDELPRIIENIR